MHKSVEPYQLSEDDCLVESGQQILDTIIPRWLKYPQSVGLQERLSRIITDGKGEKGFKAHAGVGDESWLEIACILAKFLKAMSYKSGLYGIEALDEIAKAAKVAERLLQLIGQSGSKKSSETVNPTSQYFQHVLNNSSSRNAYATFAESLKKVASEKITDLTREIAEGRSRHHKAGEVNFIPSERQLRCDLIVAVDEWWQKFVGTSKAATPGTSYANFLQELYGGMTVIPPPGHSQSAVRKARRQHRDLQAERACFADEWLELGKLLLGDRH